MNYKRKMLAKRVYLSNLWTMRISVGQLFHVMHLSMLSLRRGGGGWATNVNLTVTYIPRVGILIGHHAFDLSILYSRREVTLMFLPILTILFRPGVAILTISFRKCQNPHPMPTPPFGLDTDRCIKQ